MGQSEGTSATPSIIFTPIDQIILSDPFDVQLEDAATVFLVAQFASPSIWVDNVGAEYARFLTLQAADLLKKENKDTCEPEG